MALVTKARHADWDPSLRRWSYGRELLERAAQRNPWMWAADVATAVLVFVVVRHAGSFGFYVLGFRFGHWSFTLGRRLRLTEEMVERLESRQGGDLVPVDIPISQNRVRTGWDQGLLWFKKDMLHFEGLATTFSIAAQSVHRPLPSIAHQPGVLRIRVDCPDPMILVITARRGVVDDGRDRRNILDREVKHWLDAPRRSEQPEILPPLAPTPNAIHWTGDLRLILCAAIAVLAAVVVAIVWCQRLGGSEWILASAGCAVLGTLVTFAVRVG